MSKHKLIKAFLFSSVSVFGLFVIYNLPPVQERLGWRVAELTARFKYALSPPEQVVFVPEEQSIWVTQTSPTQSAPPASVPATPQRFSATQQPVTPTAILTPLPKRIKLEGVKHEYQTWNNCGPTTLAMALSFWGWKGDQRPIAAFTKPNSRDKNVMPFELTAYVEAKTEFEIIYQVSGEIELLQRFLAAGFPIIIEKGFEGRDFDGWMGHYVLVTGYDDTDQKFTLQDSYYGPDQIMEYIIHRSLIGGASIFQAEGHHYPLK